MTGRGIFIGVAVETYESHPRLPWTRIDVLEMDDLFSELGFPQRSLLGDKQRSPTVRELTDWLQGTIRERSHPDEPLVLYWAGHGLVEDGVHYLLASDSPADVLCADKAIAAAAIAELLVDAKVERALILLDVCNAGAGAMDLAAAINQGLRSKIAKGAGESGIVVMAVSRPTESAVDGALATVFKDSVLTDERTGTFRDKYVRLGGLFDLLNESLSEGGAARPVSANVVDWSAPLNLLPNPRWGRGGPLWNETDGVYFDRQARGASGDDTGWYFSGRERVLHRIAQWLAPGQNGGGMLAVYGPPGCGKSAVLARAITLSSPDCRVAARASPGWGPADEEGMSPEGSVGAALHARGKTLDRVVDELAVLLGVELPERPDQTGDLALTRRRALLEELHAMAWRESVTIALDGLDEAAPGQDLALAELLVDVAAGARLRVLVGTRPRGRRALDDEHGEDLLSALGVDPGDDIELSDPKWESDQALEAYLRKRLLAIWQGSTLENLDDAAADVAKTMAHRLEGQFHVARLVVGPNSVLARRGPPTDLSKLEFPTEIAQAIGDDFERFSDSSVVELLRALAWAEGDGFSEPVWLVVAGVLSPTSRFDEDAVERAISTAGDYLVPSGEDEAGRRRWRLHHSTYGEYFRRLTLEDEGADERAVEKRIVEDLTPTSWEGADSYVLTNLATHAEKAGVVGELIRDPDYLVHAEPSVLLASLASLAPDDEAQAIARRYRRTAHHLVAAGSGERAAYLELAAFEDHDPAARPSPRADQPWSFRWGWLTGGRPHRVIPAVGGAESVSLHELEGRAVAVTGGERIRVIDVETSRRLFDAPGGGGFAALVETSDGPHVLSLAAEAENPRDDAGEVDTTSVVIRRWLRKISLATRAETALLAGGAGDIIRTGGRPFAVGGNRWLAVALSGGGAWVQDCLSEHEWTPDSLKDLTASCVFVLPGEDDCIVLVGSEAGEVAAWSSASGTEARVKAHETPVRALTGTVTSGGRVLISSDRHRLHVWRLADDRALEGPLCSTDVGFEAVACAELASQLFMATLAARAVGRRLYVGRRPAWAGQCALWRVDLERPSIEMKTYLAAGEIDDVAVGGSGPGAAYLVAAANTHGALYCWEGLELARSLPRAPQRPLQVIEPERVGKSDTDRPVVALWEGGILTMFDSSNGKMRPGFPGNVGADGASACALGALELESGETVFVLGYDSGQVLVLTFPEGKSFDSQTGGRPIRAIAAIASPSGPKQMLALDENSDLYHVAWQRRPGDGVSSPPDVANSWYTGGLTILHMSLSSGEPVVKERRDLPRVLNGVSASRLKGSPAFVISGNAGCVFVDPMHPEEKADVGFDFPVQDAALAEGWLAVRGDRQVLLFHVGDDPSRASGPGLDLPPEEGAPIRGFGPGAAPIWQESWVAPVTAMTLRRTSRGLRLAVGCTDGAFHLHDVGAGGVTHVFSLNVDSPVLGVLLAGGGGTVVASWRGLLCVE